MRSECEHDRHESPETEHRGERISPPEQEEGEPDERDERRGPAEEHKALALCVVDVTREEVAEVRGVVRDLVERPAP